MPIRRAAGSYGVSRAAAVLRISSEQGHWSAEPSGLEHAEHDRYTAVTRSQSKWTCSAASKEPKNTEGTEGTTLEIGWNNNTMLHLAQFPRVQPGQACQISCRSPARLIALYYTLTPRSLRNLFDEPACSKYMYTIPFTYIHVYTCTCMYVLCTPRKTAHRSNALAGGSSTARSVNESLISRVPLAFLAMSCWLAASLACWLCWLLSCNVSAVHVLRPVSPAGSPPLHLDDVAPGACRAV